MKLGIGTYLAVMRSAHRSGLDPYNSADRYAVAFIKRTRDRLRRLDAKLARGI